MSELFIIQNQHNQFLDKHGDWVDGSERQTLYRTQHKDEAINTKVEHAVRSPNLRLAIVSANADAKGLPVLQAGNHSSPNESKPTYSSNQETSLPVSECAEAPDLSNAAPPAEQPTQQIQSSNKPSIDSPQNHLFTPNEEKSQFDGQTPVKQPPEPESQSEQMSE